jgi:hypothetical protein
VAAGRILPLLTSGLVVDGPAWPQIALLAVTLGLAVRLLGPLRLWAVALLAHVGATVVAYLALALAWVVDPAFARPVIHVPDFGISVVFAGELRPSQPPGQISLTARSAPARRFPVVIRQAVARVGAPWRKARRPSGG